MSDPRKAEALAAQRFQLIAPLLADDLDTAKARQMRKEIGEKSGWSERTLRRYLYRYRKQGFDGLKPMRKPRKGGAAVPAQLLEEAIHLRREAPHRSVAQIIQILEWEDKARPGELKRSTLQEKLAEQGYSTRQMRMYQTTVGSAKRFQKAHRNALWQSDIKCGPFLPIGPRGEKRQVYLVLFVDDATRFVLHGEFYPTLDARIVEHAFRQSVQKYGRPEAVFFDNGKQYRTKWMARTCSILGTRLLYARPYSPQAKGKVEKLNQVVDSFLGEVSLEKPDSLDQLNQLFQVWLSECHQNKYHSALSKPGKKITPERAWRSDRKAIHFPDQETIRKAFMHMETRKVDKAGCISFMNKKYEAGISLIGFEVNVVYDPADPSKLIIEKEGYQSWEAKLLKIGEHVDQRPPLPERLQPDPADQSRLLHAAEQQYEERQAIQKPAVSYRRDRKGGGDRA